MKSTSQILSLALLLLAGACGGGGDGGGGSGGGALTGTVHGQPVMIDDVISAVVMTSISGTDLRAAAIAMANAKDLCADAMSNTSHPNEKGAIILLTDIGSTGFTAPTAPGTYTVYGGTGTPPAKAAFFDVSATDAACEDVTAQSASGASGTVTLTSVSGNRFSGNFDLVLDSGDHVTGSFDPTECPALEARVNSSEPSSCM